MDGPGSAELADRTASRLRARVGRRRGSAWQLPAFAASEQQVRPAQACDVLVRCVDPARPAVLVRPGRPAPG